MRIFVTGVLVAPFSSHISHPTLNIYFQENDETNEDEWSEGRPVGLKNVKDEPSGARLRPVAFVGDDDEEEIFNLVVYGVRFAIKSTPAVSSFSSPRTFQGYRSLSPSSSVRDESISGDRTQDVDFVSATEKCVKPRLQVNISCDPNRPHATLKRRANTISKVSNEFHSSLVPETEKEDHLSRKSWTAQDDDLLLKGIAKLGRNYQGICDKYLPRRSAIAIKWRYKRFSKDQNELKEKLSPANKTKTSKEPKAPASTRTISLSDKTVQTRLRTKDIPNVTTSVVVGNKRPRRNYNATHQGTAIPEEPPSCQTSVETKSSRPLRTRKKPAHCRH